MGLLVCKKHGESGVIPTVSKNLATRMLSGQVTKNDIGTIYLRVYDEGEFLFDKFFFVYTPLDMTELKDEYVIENEQDDEWFSQNVSPIFSGGAYCVACFKEYMEGIGFELNNLRASAGITC